MHIDDNRVGTGFSDVCLSVFPHDISKTDAARISKVDKELCPGSTFILGFKDQRSRLRGTKHSAGVGRGALVSAGFF